MQNRTDSNISDSYFTYIKSSLADNFLHIQRTRGSEIFFVGHTQAGQFVRRTYSEFFRDINRTCACFKANKVDSNTNVITAASNTYEHVILAAAVLYSGLTLCPLDPGDSAERIQKKVEQIGERFIGFTDQEHILKIPGFFLLVLRDSPEEFLPGKYAADRPAIRVFTSGTTGFSKIVELSEASILANIEATIEHHRLHQPTAIGTPLPIFHVNALAFGFLGAVFSGNKLVLFREFQPERLLAAVAEEKINILSVVPHILRALHARNSWREHDLSTLRYFLTAAAPLPPYLAQALVTESPAPVIQGYGLSEAVNFSTTMPIDLSRDELNHWLTGHERPSIGIPLKGNELAILSESGEILGEKEKGEICVRGFNLMTGYKNADNSAVFRDKYLHTGDIGYFQFDRDRKQKYFFVCGRIKDTIKRYGNTISLLEIDDLIGKITPNAISVGFEHVTSGEELAVVVQRENERFLAGDLLNEINKNFPENIRPKILVVTDLSVRTPSGKPQRWKFIPLLLRNSQSPLGRFCILQT